MFVTGGFSSEREERGTSPAVASSTFIAKAGGVMTDEVGTVTGELTLRTELADDGAVRVLVQYLGADEWYHLTDAPTSMPAGTTLEVLHARLLADLAA